jgi:hypothetical protein
MMRIRLSVIALLLLVGLSCQGAAVEKQELKKEVGHKQGAADKQALDKQLKDLIAKYGIKPDCYKPERLSNEEMDKRYALFATMTKEQQHKYQVASIEKDLEKEMTCMLAGYKKVWLADQLSQYNYDAFVARFYDLLKAYNIHSLYTEHEGEDYFIFYRPEGQANAFLLMKYLIAGPERFKRYIQGKLLGYPEEEIFSFYTLMPHHLQVAEVATRYREAQENFNRDKKEADKWIKKNAPGIKEWIRKNTVRYGIVEKLGVPQVQWPMELDTEGSESPVR